MAAMRVELISSINDIDAAAWNAHCNDYPFSRHEFLLALEQSHSVGPASGWLTTHLLLYREHELIAVMPNYIKHHSWGEYVFDWSWADAYERLGKRYYPKLVAAIPFTPASGPRLHSNQTLPPSAYSAIAAAIRRYCSEQHYSGWHILFARHRESTQWQEQGLAVRHGMQYHWYNHHYTSFDDFLARCNSRKRKTLRKERQHITQYGLRFIHHNGDAITEQLWDQFYYFYQTTYAKRSGHGGYLERSFFSLLGQHMPEQLVMVVAMHHDQAIAAALNLRSNDTLYGRYWGCSHELDGLHFETCYYQGIDYCIANGLRAFDAGAQGEHKIPRGFEPTPTYSCHWLADPQLHLAVGDFIARETPLVQQQMAALAQKLPFKQESNGSG